MSTTSCQYADGVNTERMYVVDFLREEAARMRERDDPHDRVVAAHLEILGNWIERGAHRLESWVD